MSFFCSVNKRAGTLSIRGEKKKLPRRAGDGEGIKGIVSLKSAASKTLMNGSPSSKKEQKEPGCGQPGQAGEARRV